MNELNTFLEVAIRRGATDLHFHDESSPYLRVENEIVKLDFPIPSPSSELLVSQIFDSMHERERTRVEKIFESGNDVDCAFTCASGARIRANIYRFNKGLGISLRIIPGVPLSIEKIGIPPVSLELIKNKSGLILITGANGSGKSTTLAALIDRINESRNGHILTIEDPIEYVFSEKKCMISQREVGVHVPNFYSALRSSVRENPDVIMIGEMRDLETSRTALQLAETGHLVLASLHTRNAPLTIDRLISQFPGDEQSQIRNMLADNLIGIISQTLLARIDGGLVAAFEVMINNPAIRNNIREQQSSQIQNVMQTSYKYGMTVMEKSLLNLVEKRIVTPEEAMSKAVNRNRLAEDLFKSPYISSHALANIRRPE